MEARRRDRRQVCELGIGASVVANSMERNCYRSTRAFAIRRYFRRCYSRTTAAWSFRSLRVSLHRARNLKEANQTFSEGSREGLTVRSFLSSNAIRPANSMDETQTDLCSTNNSTPCMLQQVSVPLLAAANQASPSKSYSRSRKQILICYKRRQGLYRRGRCRYRCHSLHELR